MYNNADRSPTSAYECHNRGHELEEVESRRKNGRWLRAHRMVGWNAAGGGGAERDAQVGPVGLNLIEQELDALAHTCNHRLSCAPDARWSAQVECEHQHKRPERLTGSKHSNRNE